MLDRGGRRDYVSGPPGLKGDRGDPGARGLTGPAGPVPWAPLVTWASGLVCVASAPATAVVYGNEAYACVTSHIAGAFAVDYAAGRWLKIAAKGVDGVQPWKTPPSPWAASTAYGATAPADCVTYQGGSYVCAITHTSGAGFDAAKWTQIAAPGMAVGALQAANNLSDVASPGLALVNLLLAPAFPTQSATLAAAAGNQDQYATGTIMLTMPNGGARWRSGVIKNQNPFAGLVTLAVPASATLDGAANGTLILLPQQRARIIQTGATAYITEQSAADLAPILFRVPPGAAVPSWDVPLAAGYRSIEVLGSGVQPGTNGANLGLRLSDDSGATAKSGANDYLYTYLVSEGGGGAVGGASSDSYFYLATSLSNTGGPNLFEIRIDPGTAGTFSPTYLSRYAGISTNGNAQRHYGGKLISILANRANLARIFWTSGTGVGAFTLRGVP